MANMPQAWRTPPILKRGVMVRTITEKVYTIQSLLHETEESQEVDTFPKNGDPVFFSVKVQPSNEVINQSSMKDNMLNAQFSGEGGGIH